jgi:hypothetical protein
MALNTTFSDGTPLTAAQQNGLSFGLVANASITTSQQSIGATLTDLTGLSVTFTAVSSRQYMAVATLAPYGLTGEAADVTLVVAGNNVRSFRKTFPANNVVDTVTYQHVFSTTAGSTTVKLQMKRVNANNVSNYADTSFISSLVVLDMGER